MRLLWTPRRQGCLMAMGESGWSGACRGRFSSAATIRPLALSTPAEEAKVKGRTKGRSLVTLFDPSTLLWMCQL